MKIAIKLPFLKREIVAEERTLVWEQEVLVNRQLLQEFL